MDVIRTIREKARSRQRRVVLAEPLDERVLRAAHQVTRDRTAQCLLLGDTAAIRKRAMELGLSLDGMDIVDPATDQHRAAYVDRLAEVRRARGLTRAEAETQMQSPLTYAVMMVDGGQADAEVAGATCATADVLRPALQIIKTEKGITKVSGSFIMVSPNKSLGTDGVAVFADCAVNPWLEPKELAEVAICSARTLKRLLGMEPRVAMLSFSTKGSAEHEQVDRVRKATELVRQMAPDLAVDGELQADAALIGSVGAKKAPGSAVAGRANVLVFPSLDAGNIGYKLVQRYGGCEAIGPILQGLAKPVNDLSRGATVADIAGTITVAAVLSIRES
ncbi:MAG: phosphate acetyltransferase [Candidatus Riflebacteria bacterium]|nr:phosphate acetyltransferase [Candidatus Riflebacteria bacterium]